MPFKINQVTKTNPEKLDLHDFLVDLEKQYITYSNQNAGICNRFSKTITARSPNTDFGFKLAIAVAQKADEYANVSHNKTNEKIFIQNDSQEFNLNQSLCFDTIFDESSSRLKEADLEAEDNKLENIDDSKENAAILKKIRNLELATCAFIQFKISGSYWLNGSFELFDQRDRAQSNSMLFSLINSKVEIQDNELTADDIANIQEGFKQLIGAIKEDKIREVYFTDKDIEGFEKAMANLKERIDNKNTLTA